jgi:DNA-directed RNA polymerase subunit RPC12/RpoP
MMMEKTKKRLKFKCWNCGRPFSLFKEFTGAPELVVVCPFCSESCIADLAPYRRKTVEVVKGDPTEPEISDVLDLPEVIPTGKSRAEDQD